MVFVSVKLNAQNLESIGKEKPVKLNGSFSATSLLYGVKGIPSRRPPLSYFLNGNATLSIYGLSIPFSISYSNQQTNFRQPFNQYGVSPTYRWLTLHAGYRSMNFSSYTLAGHTFLGGGVEIQLPVFHIAAMYGRLNKALPFDSTLQAPTYERFGYGIKAGIGKEADYLDIILFSAKDNEKSIPFVSNPLFSPQENLVVGFNAGKKISNRFLFSMEYAHSGITRNILAAENKESSTQVLSKINPLFHANSSSAYRHAVKGNLSYAGKDFTLQAGYERIDPGYQTLGAYFFNDDLENFTLAAQSQLWKNKITLAIQTGIQRNNLTNEKANTTSRWVNSGSISYIPSPHWSLQGSYSNFNGNSRRATRLDVLQTPADTMLFIYTQVNQNAQAMVAYQINTKEHRYGISMNINYQVAHDRQGNSVTSNRSNVYGAYLSGNYRLGTGPTFTLTLNANQNEMQEIKTLFTGPSISISQDWLNHQLRTTASLVYNTLITNGVSSGNTITSRLGGNYSITKSHSFNINMIILRRQAAENTINRSFTEITLTAGYGYTF